jgi:4-hydroxybenzoate polyprenyltransferase
VNPLSLKTVKAYFDLCRVSNLPTVWTNVLAAVVLSGTGVSWPLVALLSLSVSLLYCGGMCLNDICDTEIDQVKRPSRPIPSGRMSLRNAWLFTIFLFTIGMSILGTVSHPRAIIAGMVLVLLIITYDILHKAQYFSIFLMAACRLMVFIVSALAATGSVGYYVGLAGCLQFVYVLLISVVARHENSRSKPYPVPLVPLMLSGISVLDGVIMAVVVTPIWLLMGICGAALTLAGQKFVRGD